MTSDPPPQPPLPSGALIRPFLDTGTGLDGADPPADGTTPEPPALRPFLLTAGRVAG